MIPFLDYEIENNPIKFGDKDISSIKTVTKKCEDKYECKVLKPFIKKWIMKIKLHINKEGM